MALEASGDYIGLVARLQMTAGGAWYIYVEDVHGAEAIPLMPATLVVRLWRASATGLLRGTIRLHGSDKWAPIQSNAQLEELVRAWLLSGGNIPGINQIE